MALIRMCVVPNCSQRPSWLILWIVTTHATYCTHSTAVYVFNGSLNSPPASHPPLPPTPHHPTHTLMRAICDVTVTVKKIAQNPAVLTS